MRPMARGGPQERQYSSLRDIYPEEEKRPVSVLRGLLDTVPDQTEVKPTALTGALGGNN